MLEEQVRGNRQLYRAMLLKDDFMDLYTYRREGWARRGHDVPGVSPSGYYAGRNREPSAREKKDQELRSQIRRSMPHRRGPTGLLGFMLICRSVASESVANGSLF